MYDRKNFVRPKMSQMCLFVVVCDAGRTADPGELFAMSQNNRNGQPYQCVCDIWHTICSDEPFAMIEVNTNDSA